MEISFTKRVSKAGDLLMISIPDDMREHFKHKTLVKVIKMPEAADIVKEQIEKEE